MFLLSVIFFFFSKPRRGFCMRKQLPRVGTVFKREILSFFSFFFFWQNVWDGPFCTVPDTSAWEWEKLIIPQTIQWRHLLEGMTVPPWGVKMRRVIPRHPVQKKLIEVVIIRSFCWISLYVSVPFLYDIFLFFLLFADCRAPLLRSVMMGGALFRKAGFCVVRPGTWIGSGKWGVKARVRLTRGLDMV